MTLTADDPRHGLTSGYTYHKCRCDQCTEAVRVYHREWRARGPKPISERALNVASTKALKWIRRAMPDVWDGFMEEAYTELGVERWPVGRPRGDS